MVKVARSVEMGVLLRWGVGISRAEFVWTDARERAWARFFVTWPRTLADRTAEGLRSCDSMMRGVVDGSGRRYTAVWVGVQFTDAFHRWSTAVSLTVTTHRLSGSNIPEM
jgi:hypothetical protein